MNADVEITYTDLTLAEVDGYREDVAKIMAGERNFPSVDEWILRSELSVSSAFGIANFDVQLHDDGQFFILEYSPSTGEVLYSPDIPALAVWAEQRGWDIPQPSEYLAKSSRLLWKHFWETRLVDSPYLDSVFGERETNYAADWEDLEREANDKDES